MHRITRGLRVPLRCSRYNSSAASLYADKLRLKLKEEGVATVEELKAKLKKEGKLPVPSPMTTAPRPLAGQQGKQAAYRPPVERERKDSSPVKPLDSFFNVAAIMSKPHTVEQITALWTVYHASRSSGTGRGYVSAAVPTASYEAMMERARNYPMFVLPLRRPRDDSIPSSPGDSSITEDPAEFYFLQWGIHPAPPIPQPMPKDDPFPVPRPAAYTDGSGQRNPPTSTILLTPLVQYKLHQAYAPPYFAITHYTDFARTHGLVLLQGIITPTSSAAVSATGGAADGKYMLSQLDAQMLALGVQQFYLPRDGEGELAKRSREAADLLHKFHHKPDEFEWEGLLRFKAGLLS